MFDFSLQVLLMRVVAVVVVSAVHGFTVAAVAAALGDHGPRHDGRRTLNPMAHLDPLGSPLLLLFSLGWIRPPAIEPSALRRPRRDLILIALAGAASLVVLAVVLRLAGPLVVTSLRGTARFTTFNAITTVSTVGIWFGLFNLLPLPLLSGRTFLLALAPGLRPFMERSRKVAAVVLAVLIVSGVPTASLEPTVRVVLDWLKRL